MGEDVAAMFEEGGCARSPPARVLLRERPGTGMFLCEPCDSEVSCHY